MDTAGPGQTESPTSPPRSRIFVPPQRLPCEAPTIHQLTRPHQSSFFLPGRVGIVAVQILVDTGCTTNLLSKRIFDQLPKNTQAAKEEYATHGIMTNVARLAFSGLLQTELRVRQHHGDKVFVVGDIDEDVILGMPFLAKYECQINFQWNTLTLQGQELI